MSSYVFKKTTDEATIYDLFCHLIPMVTSLHTLIEIHEVTEPKPRRVFISPRLMRLATLLQKLRNDLYERFQSGYGSQFYQLLLDCEEEICELLDYMEQIPE